MAYSPRAMRREECCGCFGSSGWKHLFALAAILLLPGRAHAATDDRGIVIEGVTKGHAPDLAGLREGDVVVRWTRGPDNAGLVESPLDLVSVEVEQAPRGPVTLQGLRGGLPQRWTVREGKWELSSRPQLAPPLLADYQQARQLAKAGQREEAARRMEAARSLAQRSQPGLLPAWLSVEAAALWAEQKNWREAYQAFAEALRQVRALHRPALAAQVLWRWADAEIKDRRLSEAGLHSEQALQESRNGGPPDNLLVARTHELLGRLARAREEPQAAVNQYRRAVAIKEKLVPGSVDLSFAQMALSQRLADLGEMTEAEQCDEKALAIRRKQVPGTRLLADTLDNLSLTLTFRGNFVKAAEYNREARELYQKLLPDGLDYAMALHNAGLVELGRGNLEESEEWSRQSLALKEKLGIANLDFTSTLNNLGVALRQLGDLKGAERYYLRALEMRSRLAPEGLLVAGSLINLGNLTFQQDDTVKSEAHMSKAWAILEKTAPNSLNASTSLYGLGEVARRRGDLARAEDYHRRALGIRATVAPGRYEHADSLGILAGVVRKRGAIEEAQGLYGRAVEAVEGQIATLGGSREVRAAFRGKGAGHYADYIDLLLELDKPEQAFRILESSRARALLETLAEARLDIRRGVDTKLLEKERDLQQQMRARSEIRIRLVAAKNEAQLAALDKANQKLVADYRKIEEQIRVGSPAYAALTQPTPVSLGEVQRDLLGDGSLLLAYSLGKERSHLFVITRDSVVTHPLPGRAAIEKAARKVYELLVAPNREVPGETHGQRRVRLKRARAAYPPAARALSRMVLGPVGPRLRDQRLVVVGDGALHYVPFAALPRPDAGRGRLVPLVVQHEVVHLPSATVLAHLRRRKQGRQRPPSTVAVIADPVFRSDDERVKGRVAGGNGVGEEAGKSRELASASPTLRRVTRSLRGLYPRLATSSAMPLQRLRSTRSEAEAIVSLAGPEASLKALDFAASKSAASSPELTRYRLVHFATHGFLDSQNPELSGLLFSMVDQQGAPQDGFLGLQDIYNLDLPVDLVVLSACETALGKEIVGEGLVGLTRGFMYAGAAQVAASLWQVDDLATAELMKRFYRAMEKDGRRPAAALRQAQLELSKEKGWAFPYYWAAFQIQGDWQ